MGKVRFIRVHGRVVPIRDKSERSKQGAKGVGLVTAGAVTSYAAQRVAQNFTLKAAKFYREGIAGAVASAKANLKAKRISKKTGQVFMHIPPSVKQFNASANLLRLASGVRGAGLAIGAGLAAAGGAKIYSAISNDKDSGRIGAAGAAGAGIAAAGSVMGMGGSARAVGKAAFAKIGPMFLKNRKFKF